MGRMPTRWWLAGVWLSLASAEVRAQRVVRISSDPVECAVTLREAANLGELSDPAGIASHALIVRVESGDFILANWDSGAEMLVYGPGGRYRESFGRRGEGPGEFMDPGVGRLRPLPDGGVLVLDPGTRRVTALSAAWELVGSTRIGNLDGRNFLQRPAGSGFIIAGWGRTADNRMAVVAEAVDSEGGLLERFFVVPTDWSMNILFHSPMALDDGGRVWYALPTEYAVEAWDPGGGARLRLEGRPGWFTPGPPDEDYPTEAPAPSVINGLRFANGYLWIVTRVSDDRWPEAVAEAMENLQPGVTIDGRLLFDTVVEVVEPATGRLLARSVLDEELWLTGDGTYLYTIRDRGLVTKAVLFTPSLVGEDCPETQ